MTRLERYRSQLAELEMKRNNLARSGNLVKATAMTQDIQKVEALIRQAEEYEEAMKPKPLGDVITKEELDKTGIILLIIECHLISDMLVEVAYMIVDRCKEVGIAEVSFMDDLKNAIKANRKFAEFLTEVKSEDTVLSDLLTDNGTLNQALHKKYVSYIAQRTVVKSKKKKDGTD